MLYRSIALSRLEASRAPLQKAPYGSRSGEGVNGLGLRQRLGRGSGQDGSGRIRLWSPSPSSRVAGE